MLKFHRVQIHINVTAKEEKKISARQVEKETDLQRSVALQHASMCLYSPP